MKLLFLFFIFSSQACQEEFQTFMKRHRKSYSSVAKLNFRKRVFCENLDKINEINSRKNITWNAAINRYSDKTWEEFKIEIGLLNDPQNCSATNRGSFQNSGKPSPDVTFENLHPPSTKFSLLFIKGLQVTCNQISSPCLIPYMAHVLNIQFEFSQYKVSET